MENYSAEIKFSNPSFTTLALSYDADITHELERGEDVHLVAIGEMKSELTEVFERRALAATIAETLSLQPSRVALQP